MVKIKKTKNKNVFVEIGIHDKDLVMFLAFKLSCCQ